MSFSVGEQITIPSPIDVHTHLREPGGEHQETIESGTLAALAGGYQAVFDMPNNPNHHETWSEDRLDEKVGIANESSHTDIGFYAGVDFDNPAFGEIPGMVRKAAGLKLYMGKTNNNAKERDLDTVRPFVDEWITEARKTDQTPPILLHAREGIGAETADYVASQGYPVHWCHVANEKEARMAMHLTRTHRQFYTGGVTVHHLTMTDRNADYQQGWNGARMVPELGTEFDAEAMLSAYSTGYIQILETDHAPHTSADKLRAEAENPTGETGDGCVTCFGISGIDFVLPVMLGLVQRGKISMERFIDSVHTQPIRMLQLRQVANTALANTTTLRIGPYVIGEDDIKGMSQNTPYVGWTGWGKVEQVVRDGHIAYEANEDNPHGTVHSATPKILRAGSVIHTD